MIDKETYGAILLGVVDTTAFAANPDGRDITCTLSLIENVRETGENEDAIDFISVQGITDVPTSDLLAREVTKLVDDAAYGDISDYHSLPAVEYTFDTTLGDNDSTIVSTFDVDLSGLDGSSAIFFTSGFLIPGNNNNGEASGLSAALASGTVLEFPKLDSGTSITTVIFGESGDDDFNNVTYDAHIRENRRAQNRNYGLTDNIRIKGSNSARNEWKGLLKFDFIPDLIASGVAASDDILSARVRLRLSQAEGSKNDSLYFYRLLKNWEEGRHNNESATTREVTWNSAEHNQSPWTVAGAMADHVTIPDVIQSIGNTPDIWYEFDVTESIKAMFANNGNFGWQLEMESNAEMRYFNSKNTTTVGHRPKLIIRFHDTPGLSKEQNTGRILTDSPNQLNLFQNYPNPFNPETIIKYHLPTASQVSLTVYNLMGQQVRSLVSSQKSAGEHQVTWDARNDASNKVESGVYFFRIQAGNFVQTQKAILMK